MPRSSSDLLKSRGISYYAANVLEGSGKPEVRLLTIWGAKGGEADVAALIVESDMDRRMLAEDARLEYVAHTRAKEAYYFVGECGAVLPARRVTSGASVEHSPSVAGPMLTRESLDCLVRKYGNAPSPHNGLMNPRADGQAGADGRP